MDEHSGEIEKELNAIISKGFIEEAKEAIILEEQINNFKIGSHHFSVLVDLNVSEIYIPIEIIEQDGHGRWQIILWNQV